MMWPIDPMRELERIRHDMDELFRRSTIPFVGYQFPLTNVYESKDEITVVAELPGVKKDDVAISLHENTLTLTGKRLVREYGKNAKIMRQEEPEGDFEKKIRIPVKVKESEIKARFQDGILRITLPKAEEAKAKQITVETD